MPLTMYTSYHGVWIRVGYWSAFWIMLDPDMICLSRSKIPYKSKVRIRIRIISTRIRNPANTNAILYVFSFLFSVLNIIWSIYQPCTTFRRHPLRRKLTRRCIFNGLMNLNIALDNQFGHLVITWEKRKKKVCLLPNFIVSAATGRSDVWPYSACGAWFVPCHGTHI